MGGAFKSRQEGTPAKLSRLETGLDVQLHLAELEVDEGTVEVVLHVFDETLQNFIAKRILLNVQAADSPPGHPPAAG